MRHPLLVTLLLAGPAVVAPAQVSIGIRLPGLSIGINQPVYPDLLPVPDSPVYYAPAAAGNYFFYDGLYWVFQGNEWYSSVWFNGPWGSIGPDEVPLFLLRVPVGYYRQPPAYFSGWDRRAPPRWGDHWGRGWERRRGGWDQWDHRAGGNRAPLPVYQRSYSGERYPGADQQLALHGQNYHYQPREGVVRERYRQEVARSAGPPQRQWVRPEAMPPPPPAFPRGYPPPPSQRPQDGPPRQQGQPSQGGGPEPSRIRRKPGRGASRESNHGQGNE